MNANQSTTMYESVPVVSELNKVTGFDPLKFIRRTNKGEKKLDLKYKKLWFRLKYPNGRIKLSALKITDQLAIIEARVYFDKNDTQPKASFITPYGIVNTAFRQEPMLKDGISGEVPSPGVPPAACQMW